MTFGEMLKKNQSVVQNFTFNFLSHESPQNEVYRPALPHLCFYAYDSRGPGPDFFFLLLLKSVVSMATAPTQEALESR